MIEEVADETIGVTLVHCEGVLGPWTEDAGSKCLCEVGNIRLVSRREVNESCKMCCNGVESGNIVQAKLAKRRLEDFNSRCGVGSFSGNRIRCGISGGGINGFDDFVNLRRNKRICQWSASSVYCSFEQTYQVIQEGTISERSQQWVSHIVPKLLLG